MDHLEKEMHGIMQRDHSWWEGPGEKGGEGDMEDQHIRGEKN